MIVLWKYEGETVRITTNTGEVFSGYAVTVDDAEDTSTGEIEITLENSKGKYRFMGFPLSDIASIEKIK